MPLPRIPASSLSTKQPELRKSNDRQWRCIRSIVCPSCWPPLNSSKDIFPLAFLFPKFGNPANLGAHYGLGFGVVRWQIFVIVWSIHEYPWTRETSWVDYISLSIHGYSWMAFHSRISPCAPLCRYSRIFAGRPVHLRMFMNGQTSWID
jgi:hypothetical protein